MLNWMRNNVSQRMYGYAEQDTNCLSTPLFVVRHTPMLSPDIGDFALYRAQLKGVMISTGEYLGQINSEKQAQARANKIYIRDNVMAFEG